jgi:oligopeptide transport system permease protein
MASLCFLAIVSLLALLTPLLPLQSPIATDTRQAYAPPTFWPLMVDSLRIPSSGDAGTVATTEGKGDWIDNQFGDLDRVNRWLVEMRAKLFGRWSLNSLCGRDDLGRDLLARLFWGARISLIVGLVAALVSLVIGVTYGAISGYCGGRIDNFMMRLVEVLYSVPFIFVVIYVITIVSEESIKQFLEQHGIDRIKILFLVVGAIYWLTMARVVRGQVLSLKHEQFVEAARTIGATPSRVLFIHIVPNLLSVIIVYLTLTIPRVMLYEAFLSFLGLGVQAPNVSWGLLANEGFHVITPVKIFWWLFVFPSLAMGMTLFALNFLGDGLRDALDPRLKHK